MKSKTLKVVPALGALAVVLLWLLGAQAAAQELLITDKNNGQAFTVRVGQKITVTLRHPGGGGPLARLSGPLCGLGGGSGGRAGTSGPWPSSQKNLIAGT